MKKRAIIIGKSLAGRIAERQASAPPPVDREAWQRDYVARSKAGTDIRSTTGQVGDSAHSQGEMNAMSPAARMAHLKRIAAAPATPHYHVLPNGGVAWGHGGANTRPVRIGERLLAHRQPFERPTPVTVTHHLDTHLGRGMRVMHPDGQHEDMHGNPLHPLRVATAAQRPAILAKSANRTRKATRHRTMRHTPARGQEGRDQRGSDVWYHARFLLDHEPAVARACGLHHDDPGMDTSDSPGDGAAAGAGVPLALALPPGTPLTGTGKRRIAAPGSRGGRFYYDQHGDVVYGERPAPHYREAQVGDHAMTPGGYGRVQGLAGDQIRVGGQGYPHTAVQMAPGHLQGDELPPAMHGNEEEGTPADAGSLRSRMARLPLPGDRFRPSPSEPVHEIQGYDPDGRIALNDAGTFPHTMHPEDYRRQVREEGVPLAPNHRHPARASALRAAEAANADPRDLALAAMRDRMEPGNEAPPDPADTSGDYPQRAQLRADMRARPYPGDTIAVASPLWLDGNSYEPGTGYTAAYVEEGTIDLYDHRGQPSGTLDTDEWQNLLDQNAVIPMKRGETPPGDDDPQIPGHGVFGVFAGKVSKEEARAAWTGNHPSGYSTTVDTLTEGTGHFVVTGSIVAPDGQHVGSFERQVKRDGRGNVAVEHQLMNVNQKMAVGFADDFNAQAEESYRRWGVGKIAVYANISVGKYCWARQGYDFADEDIRDTMVGRFADFCDDHGHQIPDNALVQMQHAWHIAEYDPGVMVEIKGHPETGDSDDWTIDGDFPLGKAFFLADPAYTPNCSGSWHGEKILGDPAHPTERQARRYRKGKGTQ